MARFFVLIKILFIGSLFWPALLWGSPSAESSLAEEDCTPAEALAVASAADDVEQIESIVKDIIPCEQAGAEGSMLYYACLRKNLVINDFQNAKLMLSVPNIFSNIYSNLIEDLKKFKLKESLAFNIGFNIIKKNREIASLLGTQLRDNTINIVQRLLYLDFIETLSNKKLSNARKSFASYLETNSLQPESLHRDVVFYLSSCDNTEEKAKECIPAIGRIAKSVQTPPLPVIIPKTASTGGRGLSSFNNKPHREWPKPFGF